MIVTITGPNDFLRSRELQALKQAFIAKHGANAVERVDGTAIELGQLLDTVQAVSLFTPQRFVIIRDLGQNKPVAEKIEQVLSAVADGVDLILFEPQLDQRTIYAKTLQKRTDFRKFTETPEVQLTSWLQAEAQARGGTLDRNNAQLLVQRVGGNQQLLSSELDKLLAYAPEVSRETILSLTDQSPQNSIFDLLEAAFRGDVAQALRIYQDQRTQSVEPQAILSMMAWQLHALLVMKLGAKQPVEAVAKQAGLSPYVARKSLEVARTLPLGEMKRLMQQVIDLEISMKSKAINVDDGVQTILVGIKT